MAAPAAPQVHPLIRYLRDHLWARRALSFSSIALLLVAVGLLGYPFYTNLYQSREQSRLEGQFASPELEQNYRNKQLKTGDSVTRIRIPDIDVDTVVVEGTTPSALRAGAGHYPETPLPCEDGNVGIAGHRTTYGKPFANIDLLKPGMEILLETPIGTCVYEVQSPPGKAKGFNGGASFIVNPDDRSVVDPVPGERLLTLTSCHPKHSAKQRIIIRAKLVKGASAEA